MHSIRASGDKIRLLCAFLKLNKFFEKSKKFALRKVFLLRSIFSSIFLDFSKNLFNFKKAQRSRILFPDALIECIRKVFVYSLLLKQKQMFRNIFNPLNPPLIGAQKHVFSIFVDKIRIFQNFGQYSGCFRGLTIDTSTL